MSHPIRVCLWATTFQANIYSLARYLASRPDSFEPLVVMDGIELYRREPIHSIAPPGATLADRSDRALKRRLSEFQPTVLVVDNRHPPWPVAPTLLNVWHGFGWRGPEDRESFAGVFGDIARHTDGRADAPNPRFRWITAGPTNYEYRIHVTGLHPDNVLPLGQAYLDDVLGVRVPPEELRRHYPPAFRERSIALFAPTWHFGRIFAHWGEDIEILDRLFHFLGERGVALILRMHDRERFEPAYLEALEQLSARHAHVLLKFKNENQDNLLDILASDFMISNYSSILTFFYPTGRPTIHIEPVAKEAQSSVYRYLQSGRLRETVKEKGYIWSLDPEEHGGLVASSPRELEEAVDLVRSDPTVCAERSDAFLAKHCAPVDGRCCERIANVIQELHATAEQATPRRGFLPGWLRRR